MEKGLIHLVKRDFITKELSLKELGEQYGLSYAYLRKMSSKEKWGNTKKQYKQAKQNDIILTDYIQGIKEVKQTLADNLDIGLILIGEMASKPEEYFYINNKVSMNKLKEFLQLIKISVDLVEKIYGGQSKYQEGMLMLHKARLELQEKIAKGDLDDTPIIEDNFMEMLQEIANKLDTGEVLYEDD